MVKREMNCDSRMSKRSRSPPQSRGRATVIPDSTMSKRSPAAVIPPVKSWTFLAATNGDTGIKGIPVLCQRQAIVLAIDDVFSPFEPSSFVEESSRKTITLRLNKEWDAALDCFEACILHEATSRSAEFFGRSLGEEEVCEMYKPMTKKTGDYPRNLRAKLNTAGAYAARYWAADKTRLDPPKTLAGAFLNVHVSLRAIWIGDDAWGVVADCTDLQLAEQAPVDCPF